MLNKVPVKILSITNFNPVAVSAQHGRVKPDHTHLLLLQRFISYQISYSIPAVVHQMMVYLVYTADVECDVIPL